MEWGYTHTSRSEEVGDLGVRQHGHILTVVMMTPGSRRLETEATGGDQPDIV